MRASVIPEPGHIDHTMNLDVIAMSGTNPGSGHIKTSKREPPTQTNDGYGVAHPTQYSAPMTQSNLGSQGDVPSIDSKMLLFWRRMSSAERKFAIPAAFNNRSEDKLVNSWKVLFLEV